MEVRHIVMTQTIQKTKGEVYLTVEEVESLYYACRKPGDIEHFHYAYVPRLIRALKDRPGDSKVPTCPGKWLVFDSPGASPQIFTVTEETMVTYCRPDNGYLWWGPLPSCVADETDDVDEFGGPL